MTCWGGYASKEDKNRLNKNIKKAGGVMGRKHRHSLSSISDKETEDCFGWREDCFGWLYTVHRDTVTHINLHMDTVTPTIYTLHMDTVTHITLHNINRYCHPHNFTHGHCHPQLNYSSLFERIQCSGTRERSVQQSRNRKANQVSPLIHGEPF